MLLEELLEQEKREQEKQQQQQQQQADTTTPTGPLMSEIEFERLRDFMGTTPLTSPPQGMNPVQTPSMNTVAGIRPVASVPPRVAVGQTQNWQQPAPEPGKFHLLSKSYLNKQSIFLMLCDMVKKIDFYFELQIA